MVAIFNLDIAAQQVPVFSQYVYNRYLYNPARAGAGDLGNIHMSYRKQWAEMPDAPDTKTLTVESPLMGRKIGLGATLYSDNSHIFRELGGTITYAYHLNFGDSSEQRLSLGLSGGFVHRSIRFDDVLVKDPDDPNILDANGKNTSLDLGFGLSYRFKGLNVDLSVPQLSNSKIRYFDESGDETDFNLISHYLGSISYEAKVGKKETFYLQPLLLVRGAVGVPTQFDFHFNADWERKFWAGVGYRYLTAGLSASTGFQVHDLFSVNYTLEAPIQYTDRLSNGFTHEFLLGFKIGQLRNKVQKIDKKLTQVDAEVKKNRGDIDWINSQIEKLEEENKKMQSEISALEKEKERLDGRMEINESEISSVEGRAAELSRSINALRANIDQNEKDIQRLRNIMRNY